MINSSTMLARIILNREEIHQPYLLISTAEASLGFEAMHYGRRVDYRRILWAIALNDPAKSIYIQKL